MNVKRKVLILNYGDVRVCFGLVRFGVGFGLDFGFGFDLGSGCSFGSVWFRFSFCFGVGSGLG